MLAKCWTFLRTICYPIYCNHDTLLSFKAENRVFFIVDRWNVYMDDVLELEMDPVTGAQPKMTCMFLME